MKIRTQEKFGLNISKFTIHRNIQKMKFSHTMPRTIHNKQDIRWVGRVKKNLTRLLVSVLKKVAYL
ncbi:hypothetical protein [Wolbachia endosymbiont of Litomosoides brasiliensis]|uniref:hypothetical protein n=1 Tax=Wolbachia endosymbiont of Litomosoides brasiliensis TaxID=1812117 RepID=UPI0039791EA5